MRPLQSPKAGQVSSEPSEFRLSLAYHPRAKLRLRLLEEPGALRVCFYWRIRAAQGALPDSQHTPRCRFRVTVELARGPGPRATAQNRGH